MKHHGSARGALRAADRQRSGVGHSSPFSEIALPPELEQATIQRMSIAKAPIRNGLRDITMDEYYKDPLIVADTLERKLAGLPVNDRKHPVLAQDIHDALRLLRATGLKQYGRISLLAVLDILQAVDYFLVLQDEKRDSRDDGYEDDAEKLKEAFKKHKDELAAFRLWFNRQP